MNFTYFDKIIDRNECIGNSVSSINIALTALDNRLSALSTYTVASVNYLSAVSDFQQVEINFLSGALDTAVKPFSANWNDNYSAYIFNNSVSSVSSNPVVLSGCPVGVLLFDCSSFAITAILPPASLYSHKQYITKKIDSTTNKLILSTYPSNLIDGVTSMSLSTQFDKLTFINSSNGWWVV